MREMLEGRQQAMIRISFNPRPDITAYELARLQVLLNRHLEASPDGTLGSDEIADEIKALAPDLLRHIKVEELTEEVSSNEREKQTDT
jgi:hypothetical protein